MSIVLRIILLLFILPFGAGIIYRTGDRLYSIFARYPSMTGKHVCLLVETVFVLMYFGLLVWYLFVR